jgi:hypothetical protein
MLFRLAFVIFMLCRALSAQFETSEVLGTVRDASGKAIPAAVVTLLSLDQGTRSAATTDEDGNYNFFNVKVGRYSLAVEHPGFAKFVASDFTVNVNARLRVDASLQVGELNQTVTVTAAAQILETDTSQYDQVINTRQVVELPLNGRNYSELALLTTNIHKSPISASFAANGTPREGAFNVNGMRSTYNNFMLDGIDNNAYSPSNQGFSNQVVQPSPDAIAEFKVITSNFSAEYGRVGGGVINAALRSGTNQFHGTVYEFLRNTVLNAAGFTFSPTVFQKPTLQRNQFGATIGGTLIKDKLFFFGDYEGFRQVQNYLNFDSIPNMNDRNGILPNTVVNPLTGTVYPAGTQIPISQVNPFAAQVLSGLPAPNGSGRANNLEALLPVRDNSDKYDAKLDYRISDRMTSFVRWSQRKDVLYQGPDITGPSGGGNNGYIHVLQQQAAGAYTWTVTPASLLEVRFGFSRIQAGKSPPYLGGPSMLDLYGIPGLPTTPNLTGGLNTQSISGFNAFGRQATNPQYQNPTFWNPKVNYAWTYHNHSIKAGYEFVAISTEVLDINPLYGSNTYSGQFSKPTCALLGQAPGCTIPADSATYNLADFIFGLPSSIGLGNYFVTNQRQRINSLYIQDDYRVTSNLTLNFGLRWEFATPLWEANNNWTNFDPATNTLIKAKDGSLYDRALVHPDYRDFGPRIGLAYSPTSKIVLRSGYGISYSFFNRVGSALENINAPQAIFGVLSQSMPSGGPVPASFLTTQKAFTTGIADPANFNPITSNIDYVDANTRWPRIQSWLFSIQGEVFRNLLVEIAYNGYSASRLPIIADYNQARPNQPGQTLGVQARRPIPTFGPITWVDPVGGTDYSGLSMRVEYNTSKGIYFLNSFTWSKALGNTEQALEVYPGYTVANPQNIRNLAAERGPTSFDVSFMNVASGVYQLPFGKGMRFGADLNRAADAVVGGWNLNAIVTTTTGTPVNVFYAPSPANDVTGAIADYRGLAVMRPNFSGAGIAQSQGDMVNHYFAGYTFTTPPASSPFGNLSRNFFRTPGLAQVDLGVNKNFTITENIRLQFRSEFFNLFNRTNFGPPTAQITSSAFGTIRTTYPARQIQFGLKLMF